MFLQFCHSIKARESLIISSYIKIYPIHFLNTHSWSYCELVLSVHLFEIKMDSIKPDREKNAMNMSSYLAIG